MPSPPGMRWRAHSSASSCCGVRARQRRVREQPEVVHAVARQPAEPARPDRDRHRRLDRDLALDGEPDPHVYAEQRAALLAEHDLERVVVAGLERAGLRDVDERRAELLLLLAAQRAEQPVRGAGSRPAGPRPRPRRRHRTAWRTAAPAWPRCWPGARSRSPGAGAARAAAGPGAGRSTTSATSPTPPVSSPAAPGRTLTNVSTVSRYCSSGR